MVSIVCDVYNHEPYLRDCLEGLVMQKTDFLFEILIHDDASTDKSAEIIREYMNKYPSLFKPIFQKENQYSKGVGIWCEIQFPRARGRYIAICEGDDYWTDPLKLQKQVDFMEAHPDFSVCFHPVMVLNQPTGEIAPDTLKDVPSESTIYELAEYSNYIHTPSVMYRYNPMVTDKFARIGCVGVGDYLYHILYAEHGKIKKLPDYMAVYRQGVGIWTGPNSDGNDNLFKWIIACAKLSSVLDDKRAQRLLEKQIVHDKNELMSEWKYYEKQYNQVLSSKTYRIGKKILKPFNFLKRILGGK